MIVIPLTVAAVQCRLPIVELLLVSGTDVNARNTKNKTVLWQIAWEVLAQKNSADYRKVQSMLLRYGADETLAPGAEFQSNEEWTCGLERYKQDGTLSAIELEQLWHLKQKISTMLPPSAITCGVEKRNSVPENHS